LLDFFLPQKAKDNFPAMVVKNILLALVLSLFLTFFIAIIYAFYPLVFVILSSILSNQEGSGIGAVGGDWSMQFLKVLLIVEPILFIFIFALLKRKNRKT